MTKVAFHFLALIFLASTGANAQPSIQGVINVTRVTCVGPDERYTDISLYTSTISTEYKNGLFEITGIPAWTQTMFEPGGMGIIRCVNWQPQPEVYKTFGCSKTFTTTEGVPLSRDRAKLRRISGSVSNW